MRRAALATVAGLAALLLAPAQASAAPPTIGTVPAQSIEGTAAVLKASVNPEGLSTTYFFEYSSQGGFSGARLTPVASAGSQVGASVVREPVSGLSPSTSYHFRLVAANGSGTSIGPTSNFTTTKGFRFLPDTSGFGVRATSNASGTPAKEAGVHPYQLSFKFGFNLGQELDGQPTTPFPDGDVRSLHIEAPPGLIENPNGPDKCSAVKFETPRVSPYESSRSGESCPIRSQIGTVTVTSSIDGGNTRRFGVYNLEPAFGVPAQIGFAPYELPIVLTNNLVPGGDGSYTLTFDATDIPQALDMSSFDLVLWGNPWSKDHNRERGNCLNETNPNQSWETLKGCKGSAIRFKVKPKNAGEETPECVEETSECIPVDIPKAYLTLPHKCSGLLSFSAAATSWQQPAVISATAVNRAVGGQPVEMSSCLGVDFKPAPTGLLSDSKASSPSGFNFRLAVDNEKLTNPNFPAPSPTKTAVVSLPPGVTINPSVGAGLIGCMPGQYAVETAFNKEGTGCPLGSKIGDFSVETPLFDGFIRGAIYLAQPDDQATPAPGAENPFDSLVAVYLVAKLPERGILVKLAGELELDPGSGGVKATFDNLPQLPYTGLNIVFRSGQRAPLITPPFCGPATTTMDLTPWVGILRVHAVSNWAIKTGIEGHACPSGATPPFDPEVVAGGVNSNVNSYTPYFVRISRKDTEQEITSYSLVLPKGITGKLAGIPFCADTAIEAARGRSGFAEIAAPSCPAASQVGRSVSGYGVGSSLTYATGGLYLAGPYHGQPLSLVAINPATIGPFDVGTIVIRSAFSVDEHTAQLQLDPGTSDRIPHILDGIPLHLRDVRIYMDRHQFTHNPSSCAASALASTVTGSGASFESLADDSSSSSSAYFQLLNCRTLGFDPKLGVKLVGGTKRRAYPELHVTYAARGQKDSNLKEIAVSMPHAEFFAQEHIRAICSRPQFNAEQCPADSVYGSAVAYTPLFDTPLRGPIYLRSSNTQIPDLVASLRSGAVHIVLEGAIGGTRKGGIRAFFSELPDEPVDRFEMTLDGGKRGLLQNSSDICANPPLAKVKALGQNNLGSIFNSKLRGQCGKSRRHSAHHASPAR